MRGWLSNRAGGPEELVLADISSPDVKASEVLIAVKACGLNFPDLLFMRDQYQIKLPRPIIPGAEVAGTVIAVGESVTGLARGDAVVAVTGSGGLADKIAVGADRCFRMPRGSSFADMGGFLFTYATAHYALRTRAQLQPGERVLILGAGGGVGLAATEIANAMGAEVFGAASTAEKIDVALRAGANRGHVYPRSLDVPEDIRALSQAFKEMVGPEGASVVVDPLGGAYTEAALRAAGWGGRYLVIGFAAGIPRIPLNLALLKGCEIIGVDWRQFMIRQPGRFEAETGHPISMVEAGPLRPRAGQVFAFEDAPHALSLLDQRQSVGKLVVQIAAT